MLEEINLEFKCPKCGSDKIQAVLQSEPYIMNIATFNSNNRPDRDLAFLQSDNTYIGYDEGDGGDIVETKYYKCGNCSKKFTTLYDVLKHCYETADNN